LNFFEHLSDEEIDEYNNGYEEIDPINYEEEEFEVEDHEFDVEDHEFDVEDHEFEVEEEEEEPFSISDEERKRQNLINEFIATEKAYIRDMEIVIDVSFMTSI
jgi:hypothetical protein